MKYLFSILLCSFVLCCQAQKQKSAGSIQVPVRINWAKGETSYLKIAKREESVSADEYSNILTTSDVRLKVLDKTDTSYTIEWTYTTVDAVIEDYELRGAILRLGREEEIRELILKMLEGCEESAKGMRVVYTTDEFGSFRDIINREELREQYRNSFQLVIGTLVESLTPEKRDSVDAMFRFMSDIMLSDPDFGLTFDDIQLLHQAYGYEYELGATFRQEGTWPSPFSDDNYPVDIEIRLDDYDSALRKCRLKGKNTITDEALKMFMTDFSAMMSEYGIVPQELDMSYEIQSEYTMNIDLSYGWIYDASMVTHHKQNHDISTTTIDIRLRL